MKTIKELEAEIKDLQIDGNDFSSVGIEERLFEIDTLKDVLKLIDELEYGSLTNVAGYKEELKKRIKGEQKQ